METRFVHFVLKICSPMRPACERTALIVHEASEMETGEQRSERTIANRRHSVFRQRPQEHDERTVSKSHSLLFHNSLVLYRFSIYLFCKYTKGIRTQYSLYMRISYLWPDHKFHRFLTCRLFLTCIAGIPLCCTLCK